MVWFIQTLCYDRISEKISEVATSDHTSDYGVTYQWAEANGEIRQHEKDAWNFQVRYTHAADLNLGKKNETVD